MILEQKIIDGITTFYVRKELSDEATKLLYGTSLKREQIRDIITHDADVIDYDTNIVLIKFRKRLLTSKNIDLFYDNIITFAKGKSSLRTNANHANTRQLGD